MTAQIVEIAGHKVVVLPVDEYERLVEIAEDSEDIAAAANAERRRNDGMEYIPAEIVDRILGGESALRVWRKYRGLSQEELAARVKTTVATISRIESGKQGGDPKRWRALADALDVQVEDIFPE
jgi:ribosome-binding protein aMBF1 (putative translation factor)